MEPKKSCRLFKNSWLYKRNTRILLFFSKFLFQNQKSTKSKTQLKKIESPVHTKSRFSSLFAFRPVWKNSNFTQESQPQSFQTEELIEKDSEEEIVLSPASEEFEEEEEKNYKMEEEIEEEIFTTFTEINSSNETRFKSRPSVNALKKKVYTSSLTTTDEEEEEQTENSTQDGVYVPVENLIETFSSQGFSEDEKEIFFSPAIVNTKKNQYEKKKITDDYSSEYDDDFHKFFSQSDSSKKRKSKLLNSATPKKRKGQKVEASRIEESNWFDFLNVFY